MPAITYGKTIIKIGRDRVGGREGLGGAEGRMGVAGYESGGGGERGFGVCRGEALLCDGRLDWVYRYKCNLRRPERKYM